MTRIFTFQSLKVLEIFEILKVMKICIVPCGCFQSGDVTVIVSKAAVFVEANDGSTRGFAQDVHAGNKYSRVHICKDLIMT